jgi:Family of unknown function (DUF6445)
MRFDPSPDAAVDIMLVGQEHSPIIRIDNVLRDPAVLVRYAQQEADFEAVAGNLYPGVRAAMPLDYVEGAVRALDPLIRQTYDVGTAKLTNAECFFSIVTTPPNALLPFQKIPHIDTSDPLHFAVVHFLCKGPFGGTAFYRQAATGFERITPAREPLWASARDEALMHLPKDAGYIDEQSSEYKQVAVVDAMFDRLILYPSNLLHSGAIPNHTPLTADPRIGRLTANFFIGYRSA